jgi:hypothetical protein
MPTKTERILSYLPGTFRALPRPTALYAVVDAFGNELLLAENSLAAIMQAHWVDHADRGAEAIEDLACIAALYGLAPRADESVEEFREHLKRYIRTFLEGTVTVQGILRVTAEALGLRIADACENLDTWWTRADDGLITVEPRGDDAAELIFGVKVATAAGNPVRPAQVTGNFDLSGGVDLRETFTLCLEVDDAGPVEINLLAGAADPAAVTLDEIVTAINDALGTIVAHHDKHYLTIASSTKGPASKLEVQDVVGDAAERILGLAPRIYHGSEALSAQVIGPVNLSDGIDLSEERYLRLVVDGMHLAEIDCAGPNPAQTTPDQLCNAINSSIGIVDLATHDGHFLTLTSQTEGFGSSIAFQKPAAQDATACLFGQVLSFYVGQDDQPARITGRRDLSHGVDLSKRSKIQLRVDGAASVMIDCAGADPSSTRPAEIVAAINTALVDTVASHDGRFITLASPTKGPAGKIVLETPLGSDGTVDIFGIGPRTFTGAVATAAGIVGATDLSGNVDLMARHLIKIAVDSKPWAEVDLRAGAANPRAVAPGELAIAINSALCPGIATHDGQHLILTSPTTGSASSLAVEPLEITRFRRFVTQAMITDEASQAILGFTSCEARGTAATRARLIGKADLSRGVDLREARYLRLAIDDRPAVDIDCAGTRPRATMIDKVVKAINDALGMDVAAHDDRHLVLTSPSFGAGSRIVFEPPKATDALDRLLGLEPATFRGQDATGITFVGTVDLNDGVDLDANAAINLAIDGAEPVEITLGDPEPSHKTLNQLMITINLALKKTVATHDGTHIILTSPSPSPSANSQIVFSSPEGSDATAASFGITPPRSYHGAEASPARVTGTRDLSGGANLQIARFLSLAVDGQPAVDVDCAAQAADPTAATIDEIVEAINVALEAETAFHDGMHLILKSPTSGLAGWIMLDPYTSGDARHILLGEVEDVTRGSAPAPAVITGEVDLLTPVDLSQRRLIRLAVDGGRPVDIDVAGAAPATTLLDEIMEAVNTVLPGLAAATEDDRLRFTSPTPGEESRLSLLPLRYLEVVEYPPEPAEMPARFVRHGDGWPVVNDGAADVFAEVQLTAPRGVVGPSMVNVTLGWSVRLLTILNIGETARLWRDPRLGLQATILSSDGEARPVPGSEILAGPLGAQAWVPFKGTCPLTGNDEDPAALQLNNPLAPSLVRLRARRVGGTAHAIAVTVTESDLTVVNPDLIVADGSPARLVGRIRADEQGFCLLDANEAIIACLRAGPYIELAAYQDRVVAVTGPLYASEPLLMIVHQIDHLFDVTLRFAPDEGDPVEEVFRGVTIGVGTAEPDSLVWQINAGPQFSQLVKAEELNKGIVLTLPRGQSDWIYGDCHSSRFNQAHFNAARFAGDCCDDRGVFNVSRFAHAPPEPVAAVFASAEPLLDPAVEVVFRWPSHRPGAFCVNLPADLPARFGGRFNEARFGQKKDTPELYEKAVTEPPDDPDYLVTRINAASTLVGASVVPRVPLGWEAVTMPFRKPEFLTLGAEDAPARLYLAEEGIDGFIKLEAREVGTWGNEIAVSARQSGPAMYDVAITYQGSLFENARQVALGKGPQPQAPRCQKEKAGSAAQQVALDRDLPTLIQDLLQPGPIGVLQAKAAGVQADISRDRRSY